jgi:ferredoxin/flavodoxin
MQDVQKVHLVYFSGTGGTKRVAGCMGQAFLHRGCTVTVTELNARPTGPVEADLTVLLYPVYACNAPVPVDEWIAQAPDGNGAPAAVVSVSGGGEVSPNTACRVSVIRKLEAKGYRVRWETMFVMPANFLIPYGDALTAMLLRAAPEKAERFASDILSGRERRTKPIWVDKAFSRLFAAEKKGSVRFGRMLHSGEACTGCGWCVRNCPRGNINMRGGKPEFGAKCVICLRCVYGCPAKAIKPGIMKSLVLKQGFDLDAAEGRTKGVDELPPLSGIAKGFLYKGVREYLEEP